MILDEKNKKSNPCNYPNSLEPSIVVYAERWPSSKHLEQHTQNPHVEISLPYAIKPMPKT